jgi:hypothetical protein
MSDHAPRGDARQPSVENAVDTTSGSQTAIVVIVEQIIQNLGEITARSPGTRVAHERV